MVADVVKLYFGLPMFDRKAAFAVSFSMSTRSRRIFVAAASPIFYRVSLLLMTVEQLNFVGASGMGV